MDFGQSVASGKCPGQLCLFSCNATTVFGKTKGVGGLWVTLETLNNFVCEK